MFTKTLEIMALRRVILCRVIAGETISVYF